MDGHTAIGGGDQRALMTRDGETSQFVVDFGESNGDETVEFLADLDGNLA